MTYTWKADHSRIAKRSPMWAGFTLIEAIIAMMIFAMAGLFLISASAANYRSVKLNELRSQMENIAIDGVNQVRQAYNEQWNNLPAPNSTTFYRLSEIKPNGVPSCTWVGGQNDQYLEPARCEVITTINNGTFVRAISITDATRTANGVTLAAREVEVVVSCQQGRCDAGVLPPFHLRYRIYR